MPLSSFSRARHVAKVHEGLCQFPWSVADGRPSKELWFDIFTVKTMSIILPAALLAFMKFYEVFKVFCCHEVTFF